MLGTGNAGVTEYFNTCFVINDEDRFFLVDTGGGNGLMRQLKRSGVPLGKIKDIFITHRHTDHILGLIWILRMLSKKARWEEDFKKVSIYGNADVIKLINTLIGSFFSEKEMEGINSGIDLIQVEDGDEKMIIGHKVRFFDIHSLKADQFGFSMELSDGRLACLGDEPYNESCREYLEEATWLMHEAFCLYSQADEFKPYKKFHSTVKDACETAEHFGIDNLILYHTEEQTGDKRRDLYTAEGQQYYNGNLYVPEDLEVIEI
mgnify:CR=1 FL=1